VNNRSIPSTHAVRKITNLFDKTLLLYIPLLALTDRWNYQSKTICEHKNNSYEAHLCPIIVKMQRTPNAQETLQIIDRHYEELKSSRTDSQTLKKAF
jgi:hypothetical protein